MCISQDRGGHHGRLDVPIDFKREVVAPETTSSMGAPNTHDRKRPRRNSRSCHLKHPSCQVQHQYVDHSGDCDCSKEEVEKDMKKHCEKQHFPIKLHAILERVDEEGLSDIITWLPHGRAFRVNKQEIFMKNVMPHHFELHKYASFQRQLNLCK